MYGGDDLVQTGTRPLLPWSNRVSQTLGESHVFVPSKLLILVHVFGHLELCVRRANTEAFSVTQEIDMARGGSRGGSRIKISKVSKDRLGIDKWLENPSLITVSKH